MILIAYTRCCPGGRKAGSKQADEGRAQIMMSFI